MTLTSILLQAVASLLAIITFLIVLNVQRSMLLPGGVLGMGVWLLYLVLKEPTNVIVATFIAAVVGSCISQILSIVYKTPAVVFVLAILAPLVRCGTTTPKALAKIHRNSLNKKRYRLKS